MNDDRDLHDTTLDALLRTHSAETPPPAVDAAADLDAHRLGNRGRSADTIGEVDLPEAAFAEEPLDPVAQARFRAADDFRRSEQRLASMIAVVEPSNGSGRGCRGVFSHSGEQ